MSWFSTFTRPSIVSAIVLAVALIWSAEYCSVEFGSLITSENGLFSQIFSSLLRVHTSHLTAPNPDTTAVILNWSRFENVVKIVSNLCDPSLQEVIATIYIWNNSPRMKVSTDVCFVLSLTRQERLRRANFRISGLSFLSSIKVENQKFG
jgi:hypothetical protein